MDLDSVRWAQIIFWSREDLEELQRREVLQAKSSEALVAQGKGPLPIEDLGWMAMMQKKYSLEPYWVDCDEPTKELRMKQFERSIYPIWKGIASRMIPAGAGELAILHAQDLAIFASGERITRIGSTGKQDLKQKMGDQFREVFGGG